MSILVTGRAARTGIQEYPTGPEYRDASEVFAPESMATWKGAPVTVGHPSEFVTLENVAKLAVGFVRGARRDGDHVLAELVIFRADAIEAVQRGELVELSAGYEANVVRGRQTQIRINHLALLPAGHARCGASCSLA